MYRFNGKKIWVAGAHGMVGAAITRACNAQGLNLIPSPPRQTLDLQNQAQVHEWIGANKPDLIFLAAAKVGGIMDNLTHPADFLANNLQIQTNILTSAAHHKVQKLIFLGSSCIYPKNCPQPMREDDLGTSPLEPTNSAYATAKLAGIALASSYRKQYGHDFISLLPCNLYGENDTYHPQNSHVIPALILKIKSALNNNENEVTLWGTGTPLREFMHVDDLASACLHAAQHYSHEAPLNIGSGHEISIQNLAHLIAKLLGYKGKIRFDKTKPDGMPRKLLDSSRLNQTGWQPSISLEAGLKALLTSS